LLPGFEVVGRFARTARLDVITEVVKRDGNLATGLVGPLSNLGRLVDGDTGSDDYGRGDYEA
jgi:hypothetical protein